MSNNHKHGHSLMFLAISQTHVTPITKRALPNDTPNKSQQTPDKSQQLLTTPNNSRQHLTSSRQFLTTPNNSQQLPTTPNKLRVGHSTKSWEWGTPAKNLQSSVAILSSEIPLFSDHSEFVGSCLELSGVVRSCWELLGVCWVLSGVIGSCQELSGVSFGEALLVMGVTMCL